MKKDTASSGLSPSVEALVAHERVLPPQGEDVRARLLSRAHEAVEHGPPPAAPAHVRPTGVTRPFVAGAAGLAVVAGLVAAFQMLRSPEPSAPPAAATVVSTPLEAPPPAAPSSSTVPEPETPRALDTAPALRTSKDALAPSSAPSNRQEGGLEELRLLSRARQADARGDYGGVLSLVTEHERSFPAGRLSEEREVLRVKALVGLGRGDQARRAASKFRRQFPRSVLLHKVDEMLPSKP